MKEDGYGLYLDFIFIRISHFNYESFVTASLAAKEHRARDIYASGLLTDYKNLLSWSAKIIILNFWTAQKRPSL